MSNGIERKRLLFLKIWIKIKNFECLSLSIILLYAVRFFSFAWLLCFFFIYFIIFATKPLSLSLKLIIYLKFGKRERLKKVNFIATIFFFLVSGRKKCLSLSYTNLSFFFYSNKGVMKRKKEEAKNDNSFFFFIFCNF